MVLNNQVSRGGDGLVFIYLQTAAKVDVACPANHWQTPLTNRDVVILLMPGNRTTLDEGEVGRTYPVES